MEQNEKQHQKDIQFMRMARCVAQRSKCSSRQVGAVLVQDGSICSEGFNGSPRGSNFCQDRTRQCRRRDMGFGSGEGVHECPAVHGETNCIVQAARNGIRTKDSTMYCYCGRPCRQCMGVIINAGVSRLVFLKEDTHYDELSGYLLNDSDIQWKEIDQKEVDSHV